MLDVNIFMGRRTKSIHILQGCQYNSIVTFDKENIFSNSNRLKYVFLDIIINHYCCWTQVHLGEVTLKYCFMGMFVFHVLIRFLFSKQGRWGALADCLLKKNPHMTVTVFDLPDVVSQASPKNENILMKGGK